MSVLRTSSRLLRSQIRRVQSVPVALYHENVSVSQHVLTALSTHIDLTESSFVISFIYYIHTHAHMGMMSVFIYIVEYVQR